MLQSHILIKNVCNDLTKASNICLNCDFSLDLSPSTPVFCTDVPRRLTFTWWGCCSSCFQHKPAQLAHSFLFCSCDCFHLYGPFNRISFHKFSQQLSAFSPCSSGLISALLVLSSIYLFTKKSLSALI